jgi:hypothetical protein
LPSISRFAADEQNPRASKAHAGGTPSGPTSRPQVLAGRDVELAFLRRAARDLQGDLVLS